MDYFNGVRQMLPTFFETSAFKTPLSMRLSFPIEFIVSLCNLLRVKQCIIHHWSSLRAQADLPRDPDFGHVVVHVRLAGKYSKAPAPKIFPIISSLTKVRSFVRMLSFALSVVLCASVRACAATFRDVK